jgi:hypothetical protein
MEDAEFMKHATSCSTCQEILKLDEDVMSMATSLRQHIEAPHLWTRIKESLVEEMAGDHRFGNKTGEGRDFWRIFKLAPAIVALFLVVWIGIYLIFENHNPSSGLMAQKTLTRVEKKEQEYVKAIQDLEKQAILKMADMGLKLVFLYRDRLETIDAQIKQCQEALAFNPANTHIRRYLMMALQDKKETLVELLNPKNENKKSRRSI